MDEHKVTEIYRNDQCIKKPNGVAQLYYWAVVRREDRLHMCGNVVGHTKFVDSRNIHTSQVMHMQIDWDAGLLIAQTRNTLYYCPLEYCDFDKQDEEPDLIEGYAQIRAGYKDLIVEQEKPDIEEGQILLVFSNFDTYWFHRGYFWPTGSTEPERMRFHTAVGTFQDSCHVRWESPDKDQYNEKLIDIRYFPHPDNIEFYMEPTSDKEWYIKNIGTADMTFQTNVGRIIVSPGEQKRVCEESSTVEERPLSGGDLYPPVFIW